jgi:hypothetical protein
LSEADARREVRGMNGKRKEREEGIDRDVLLVVKVLRKGGRDGMDFLCNLLIS